MAINVRVWRGARNRLSTAKISFALGSTKRYGIGFSLVAALLRQRRLPFLPLGGCLRAKGDLLSIAPQELLLDSGRSPPGLDHGIATWHTSDGYSLPGDRDLSA